MSRWLTPLERAAVWALLGAWLVAIFALARGGGGWFVGTILIAGGAVAVLFAAIGLSDTPREVP